MSKLQKAFCPLLIVFQVPKYFVLSYCQLKCNVNAFKDKCATDFTCGLNLDEYLILLYLNPI